MTLILATREYDRWQWRFNQRLGSLVPSLCTEVQVLLTKRTEPARLGLPNALVLLVLLLVGTTVVGCGRREKRAWFDAQPPAIIVAAIAKPLPQTALRVRWGTLAFPRTVDADRIVLSTVSFTNEGDAPWPDNAAAHPQLKDGSYAVRLTHAWVRADDADDSRLGAERTDLPRPVMAGDSIDLRVRIRTPAEPGEYRLVIELVQELVQWFADGGADRIMLPVHVVPPGEAPAGPTSSR